MVTTRTPHPRSTLDLLEVLTRYTDAIRAINRPACDTPERIAAALADVPDLCAEVEHLRTRNRATRTELANLRAAARATIAAHHDGEHDPLSYLRDELAPAIGGDGR